MNLRSTLVLATLASVALTVHVLAQQPEAVRSPTGGPTVRNLMAQNLEEHIRVNGEPGRLTMLEVTWEPGGESPAHRHPCPTFVYVLEGELETRIGDGPVRQYRAGDTLYEPTMILHADTRNLSNTKPARVLAIHIHDRETKQLVIPENQP
ncbi:Cupin domain protein [Maioricimonas rarisocia]|uniref:Cupin domain protein n=1 Tax=Maioricimonas rarisocia TaxID=2528026 RepID=A0A517ZEI7_9PLAN|nr:cupin domain-containing protein [Maioricimonas rarisocia]QDU40915.1 Cupin domain protein [Maioricimonas rarisocia]